MHDAEFAAFGGTDFSLWFAEWHRRQPVVAKSPQTQVCATYGSGVESRKTANDASQCSPA
jgi:hypothetical protein